MPNFTLGLSGDEAMSSVPHLLLVAGSGRSGSTILDLALSKSLPGFSVGEFRWLWSRGLDDPRQCSCGSPIPDCSFWQAVSAELHDRTDVGPREWGAHLEAVLQRRRAAHRVAFDTHGRLAQPLVPFFSNVYDIIRANSRASVIIDSSKFFAFVSLAYAHTNLSPLVVHLVRDPRAVAYSWTRRRKRPDVTGRTAYMPRYPAWKVARSWVYQQLTILRLARRWDHYLLLRYEDFSSRPEANIQAIRERLSLRHGQACSTKTSHAVDGNPVRFSGSTLPPIRPDLEWLQRLPLSSRLLVTVLTAPLLSRFRYPLFVSKRKNDANHEHEEPSSLDSKD